ncbi:E3 binding domain-containing protein, partial [Xanthomonas citri pv. citri]
MLAEVGFGAAQEKAPEQATVATSEPPAQAPTGASVAGDERGSSPRARNLAAAEGIDIAAVPAGTGPGGRVIARDVAAVAETTTRAAARAGAVAGEGTGLGGRVSQADLTAPAAPAEATSTPVPAAVVGADLDFPGPSTST